MYVTQTRESYSFPAGEDGSRGNAREGKGDEASSTSRSRSQEVCCTEVWINQSLKKIGVTPLTQSWMAVP